MWSWSDGAGFQLLHQPSLNQPKHQERIALDLGYFRSQKINSNRTLFNIYRFFICESELKATDIIKYMSNYKYELYIYIMNQSDAELVSRYRKKVGEHNQKIRDRLFADSGFDIFMPFDGDYYLNNKNCASLDGARFLGLGLKCAMRKREEPCGFYLYI